MSVVATARGNALELEEFGYRYPQRDVVALESVSLAVARGEFVLVCGRSGSGKSTLLRTAGGLVPHHFGGEASGEAAVCGVDLRDADAGQLAAFCGTVMQDPEVQIVMGRVRREIAFPLENLGWEQSAIAVAVEETAAVLGISHLLDRRTEDLSGGELQRVVLAAAVAARPPLVALDEPTSQLDPVGADEFFSVLRRLNADHGTTVLLAEHRIERCIEFADRVVFVDDGRIAFDGDPADFLDFAAYNEPDFLPSVADCFHKASIAPLPVTLKEARAALQGAAAPATEAAEPSRVAGERVLAARGLTVEYGSRTALDAVEVEFRAGERIALMGANGSGKSTLLRVLRSVQKAQGGSLSAAGEVALLLQNPNDYLMHDRVADEAPMRMLERFGLADFADRDPHDLSGGERQRLALAIVMQSNPRALLLDEPSRGMDTAHRDALVTMLNGVAADGAAVVVATHDAELAARFADRVVLLGNGRVIADAPARDLLSGGWHYSTEVAKLLPGSGALTPAEGASLIGGVLA